MSTFNTKQSNIIIVIQIQDIIGFFCVVFCLIFYQIIFSYQHFAGFNFGKSRTAFYREDK